ncbi:helix-turn-helix transcriptional regulator [bacterium]|nr:helix-turn-helix transcriptional regulator [bacterium]
MSGKPYRTTLFDIKLGELIAMHRRMLGMSQKDLAEKLGVSFQQIQKYETAKNNLSASRLFEIATVFEMSVGQLVDGTEQKYILDSTGTAILKIMYKKMNFQQRLALLQVARTMISV